MALDVSRVTRQVGSESSELEHPITLSDIRIWRAFYEKTTGLMIVLFLISGCVSGTKVANPYNITDDRGGPSLVLPKTTFGKWAVTVKGYLGVEKYRDCVDPNQLITETLNQSGCQVADIRQSGDTYTYVAKCNKLEGIDGKTAAITFSISGTDSAFNLVSQVKSEEANFRTEVQAKRIGECSPSRGPVDSCVQTEELECSDCKAGVCPPSHGLFAGPCIQHDYCYRHGWESYRFTKADCDNRFRVDMMKVCSGKDWLGAIACRNTASLYYDAVKDYGGSSYHGDGESTCCRFTGDAEPCQQCSEGEGGKYCPVAPPPPPPPPKGRCCEMDYETHSCVLYVMPPRLCP